MATGSGDSEGCTEEGGRGSRQESGGQPWVVPFSEFATFFVAIREKKEGKKEKKEKEKRLGN